MLSREREVRFICLGIMSSAPIESLIASRGVAGGELLAIRGECEVEEDVFACGYAGKAVVSTTDISVSENDSGWVRWN